MCAATALLNFRALPPIIVEFCLFIQDKLPCAELYLVGGAVRDILRGVRPKDYDFATSATPDQLNPLNDLENSILVLDEAAMFGTTVFIFRGERIEVTTFRKDIETDGRHATVQFSDSIVEDLARRDLTINAMAYNVRTGELVDPFCGQQDMERLRICTVGSPSDRYREDYLRIVRTARFAGLYGKQWEISEDCIRAAKDLGVYLLHNVSHERIRDEVLKMMSLPSPSVCIEAARQMNILEYILQPVYNCIGVDQNKHHNETVYEHVLGACDFLPADKPLLRLAGLLHDVGKPDTKAGEGAESSFHNHEVIGSKLVWSWAKNYHFSNEECEYLSKVVRYHMFHFEHDTKERALKRWLRKVGEIYQDLLLLRMADRASNKAKKNRPLVTEYMQELEARVIHIRDTKTPMQVTDLKISGRHLIDMGFHPGPRFGDTLRQLLEKVTDGELENTLEALLPEAKRLMSE